MDAHGGTQVLVCVKVVLTPEQLAERGAIEPVDLQLSLVLARLGGDHRPAVRLAVALASAVTRNGDSCFFLSQHPELVDANGDVIALETPSPEDWQDLLLSSPLVGDGAMPRPLVVSQGRVQLRRYWQYEDRLGGSMASRAHQVSDAVDLVALEEGLATLFSDPDSEQARAARAAVLQRFTVITGGPGTGKTSTVVRVLALLHELAGRGRAPYPTVTLLAPTGKAAARLVESIRLAKGTLPCAPAVRDAIVEEASTIHRALRPIPGTLRFRHDAGHPLVTDVVLVDEASMVDLGLMTRLVDAVPSNARLVLLGDRNQLASVEVGAVLGDIYKVNPSNCVVSLTKSHRYAPDSGIAALARAVEAGDGTEALALLSSRRYRDIGLCPTFPAEAFRQELVQRWGPMLEAPTLEDKLALLGSYRVLTAHRRGPDGVERLNELAVRVLERAGLLRVVRGSPVGAPVLVTANDYELGLFNGDIGLLVEDRGSLAAVFVGADGNLRRVAASRLPPHETVFAMTVHKSQGSEFEHVSVVLGQESSPLLTRELLYTALTRARRSLTLYGTAAALTSAVKRPVRRASGLSDALLRHGQR
jgi:exodeoxyribonuclease V alpha subunit